MTLSAAYVRKTSSIQTCRSSVRPRPHDQEERLAPAPTDVEAEDSRPIAVALIPQRGAE